MAEVRSLRAKMELFFTATITLETVSQSFGARLQRYNVLIATAASAQLRTLEK